MTMHVKLHSRVVSSITNIIWAAPAIIMSLLFFQLFIVNSSDNWEQKYSIFSVPAFNYPGADARNIQLMAFCTSPKVAEQTTEDCYEKAAPIKFTHKEASVPPYNYPNVWFYIYRYFNDFSEEFFMSFWKLNASAICLTVLILALRTKPSYFTLTAFSPVMLLTVERGNIEAFTFTLMYAPILIFPKLIKISSIFIILGALAKIFPIVALPALFIHKLRKQLKFLKSTLLLAIPFLIITLSNLSQTVEHTTKGFLASYGLLSLLNAPYFQNHHGTAYVLLAVFLLTATLYTAKAEKYNIYQNALIEIKESSTTQIYLFYTSILVFGITFLMFTNWSYRLIFLFPALFVLSNYKSFTVKIMIGLMLSILWLPITPYGWASQNILCYVLFVFLCPIYLDLCRQLNPLSYAFRRSIFTASRQKK
ncbi:hypothetical protein N9R76_01100 [Planktomarina temperata]|nr:hypothetical protein [Planktomarina temperata]